MLEESSSEVTSSSAGLVMSPVGVGGGVLGGSGGGGMSAMQSNGHHHHSSHSHNHHNPHSNGLTLSPNSLGSPEYDNMDQMWYDDSGYGSHGVIGSALGHHQGQGGLGGGQGVPGMTQLSGGGQGVVQGSNGGGNNNNGIVGIIGGHCTVNGQTTMVPLPSMTHGSMGHTPRSTSANSISSGNLIFFEIII